MVGPDTSLDALAGQKYLSLETYRRDGHGVRTPVWFASETDADGGTTLYVYSTATSGKARRLRRSGRAKVAACDVRGTVTGSWIDAKAELVEGAGFARGMQLIDRKYWPWKQLLDLGTRLFSRHQRVVIAIHAA